MAGSLDPMRSEVFNLRDLWVEIDTENQAGTPSGSPLTEYWLYINSASLQDKVVVKRNFQCGAVGRRLTTTSHDYTLSLSRFQAKFDEDFNIVSVSPDNTYQIKLILINDQNPSLTETHTLKHCQLESRSLRMSELVNTVPTQWAVGEYTPPS